MTIDMFGAMIIDLIAVPAIFALTGFILGFAVCITLGVKRV